MDTGTLLIPEPIDAPGISQFSAKVAIYSRVSAAENQENLESQSKRWQDYCAAKGYPVAMLVKEIGCGVNDARPKRLKLRNDPDVTRIIVEHKERLTRFGDHEIEPWLKMQNRKIEVIHLAENGQEDLVRDFVSLLTSFCARLDGQRGSKRKTERIIAELTETCMTRVAEP